MSIYGQFLLFMVFVILAGIATWISFGSERRLRRELKRREPLDDAQFYETFYAGSEVPSDIPLRLRPIYCRFFEIETTKLHASDRPPEIAEIDTVELIEDIEAEFGVEITDKDAEQINGSFDSIVQYLANRLKP